MTDWYPKNREEQAAWHRNFADHLSGLQAKYNLTAGQVTAAIAAADWMEFWVQARHNLDLASKQLTQYIKDISGSDPTLDPPAVINIAIGDGPPEVPPGVEFRTREIARQMKGHAAYAEADGELLGIESSETPKADFGDTPAKFKVKSLPNFAVEATFTKNGSDAMRFEFRRKDGGWQQAGFLLSSPGVLTLAPVVAGVAEQIELRGIMMKKNQDVGNFSDHVPVFIAP